MWSILEKVPCALEKKVKFIVLGWNVLYISIRSNWSVVAFKVCVSLLIFCLVDLSLGVSGVFKSLTIIVLLLISPFIFVSICLTYWRRQWQPTPVLFPGKSHGQRSLAGCSPWGCEESDTTDTTERLHFHFSLSCIGEGNGNPLQCSCLENPKDGGAWWAAVSGVAQSRTRLKRLSSSSR